MISREGMIHFARETLGLSESDPIEVSPFRGRGSDRAFSRLAWNSGKTVIVVHYDSNRIENTYFADIAVFLGEIHVPSPQLIRHDPVGDLIMMEDLGDTDLWSFREAPWNNRQLLYQKTLAIAHRLHSFPEDDFPSGRVKLMEAFGPDLYHWERDYFRNHFVRSACRIEPETCFGPELEAELSALAERLGQTGRSLVHRDLQSQNVMIQDGEPFLIDFQGMRFGSPFYDLGSLLCDPYVHFSEGEREELLSFYYRLSKTHLDRATFETYFWEGAVQRLMQALGAYGFLGLKKGLRPFLDHIPAGLRNLQVAAAKAGPLPRLQELCVECERGMRDSLFLQGE